MASPEVQKLVDTAGINDTVQAYAECLDRADINGLVNLFCAQATMDMGGGALYRGHSEIRDLFLDRFLLYKVSNLHCGVARLKTYDGSTAQVTSSLYAFFDAAEQDLQMQVWGRYDDVLVADSGVWKFQERHLLVAAVSHSTTDAVPDRFNRLDRLPIAES